MGNYLTYTNEFQEAVVSAKQCGYKVKDICKEFDISVYTLYKILRFNNYPPIPSEASGGIGSEERVERSDLSPNNNNHQERPASISWYRGDRHSKVKYKCINCRKIFYTRDRGKRTKFCSLKCRGEYRTLNNSTELICDNCGKTFRVKNSQVDNYIHCEKCRGFGLGAQSSKKSRLLGKWLKEEFVVEKEKSFNWFYDSKKPKGRFKLDYFLPKYKLAIEYDGEQHFKPSFTSKWESVDKVQKRDRLKEKLCDSHGITTIRFRYDESLTKDKVLMKIYAELQGKELVEVEDKKPLR